MKQYHNIHKDQTGILFGTGTTLRNVMGKMFNDNFIRVGVNSFVYNDKITLDYFFAGDPNGDKGYNKNRKAYNDYLVNEQKFYRRPFENIDGFDDDNNGVNYDILDRNVFHDDISKGMGVHTSIIFEALQFMVYTGMTKIYLVGMTCVGNRSTEKWLSQLNPDYPQDAKTHIEAWTRAKEWLKDRVEIVDVEPEGLKGVFMEGFIEELLAE